MVKKRALQFIQLNQKVQNMLVTALINCSTLELDGSLIKSCRKVEAKPTISHLYKKLLFCRLWLIRLKMFSIEALFAVLHYHWIISSVPPKKFKIDTQNSHIWTEIHHHCWYEFRGLSNHCHAKQRPWRLGECPLPPRTAAISSGILAL